MVTSLPDKDMYICIPTKQKELELHSHYGD